MKKLILSLAMIMIAVNSQAASKRSDLISQQKPFINSLKDRVVVQIRTAMDLKKQDQLTLERRAASACLELGKGLGAIDIALQEDIEIKNVVSAEISIDGKKKVTYEQVDLDSLYKELEVMSSSICGL